jgi:hypothetical protein
MNGDRNNSERPTAVSESGNHLAENIALEERLLIFCYGSLDRVFTEVGIRIVSEQ